MAFLTRAATSTDSWYVSEGICCESLRVATHPAVFPVPPAAQEAVAFLCAPLESDAIHVLSASARHWSVLVDVLSELHAPGGNLFFDGRTAALMREHGVRKIYTSERDFLQFPTVEIGDPVAA